jgi:hypothetical protein
MACDVAGMAGPGDTVTVADTLPDPPAGQARYYLAAVSHGGERRAGRRNVTGLLEGRPAGSLPACP